MPPPDRPGAQGDANDGKPDQAPAVIFISPQRLMTWLGAASLAGASGFVLAVANWIGLPSTVEAHTVDIAGLKEWKAEMVAENAARDRYLRELHLMLTYSICRQDGGTVEECVKPVIARSPLP